VRSWSVYAGSSAVLVGISALMIGYAFGTANRLAIWVGFGSAWLVQAAAFAILIATVRRRPKRVLIGWTAGTILRLAAVGVAAWLTLGDVLPLPAEPTLLALVAALFLLLLLEPVVFRYRYEAR
jgi:zinc transporter ZupT